MAAPDWTGFVWCTLCTVIGHALVYLTEYSKSCARLALPVWRFEGGDRRLRIGALQGPGPHPASKGAAN